MIEAFHYTEKETEEILKSIVILIDTREKECSHITDYFDSKQIKHQKKALGHGDYSFLITANPALSIPRDLYFTSQVVIERKANLEELSNNLSNERDRFEKELSGYSGKMILLIENAQYSDIVEGRYNTEYNKKSYLGSLHSFWFKHDVPFFFMPDNKYSGAFILRTFYYYLKNYIR